MGHFGDSVVTSGCPVLFPEMQLYVLIVHAVQSLTTEQCKPTAAARQQACQGH